MIGLILIALVQPTAPQPPAVPVVMVAKKSLKGGFSCALHGRKGDKFELSGKIVEFEDLLDKGERVKLELKAPSKSGLSGIYYGERNFDVFKLTNALDFNSQLVEGVKRQAHLVLWTPVGSPNGVLGVDAVEDIKLQIGSVTFGGICSVNFTEDFEY